MFNIGKEFSLVIIRFFFFYFKENGRRVELDENTGIDTLGNLIESSIISRNRNYYGDFHNFGHLALSLCHDPDAR